jgi:hypothetical protein
MTTAALASVAWPHSGTSTFGVDLVIVFLWHEKSGFGQVVFVGNGLHHGICREALHQHHGCGVTRKPLRRERVNLEDADLHCEVPMARRWGIASRIEMGRTAWQFGSHFGLVKITALGP